MSRTTLTFAAALAVLTLLAAPAAAQDDEARLQELLEDARTARADERFDDALTALLRAYNIAPAPALLFNIAKVYQDQGDCTNSLDYYLKAHEEGLASEHDESKLLTATVEELRAFSCPGGPEATIAALEPRKGDIRGPIHLRLGDIYVETSQCEMARASYLQATKVAPAGDEVSEAAIVALKDFECPAGVVVGPGDGTEDPPPLEPDEDPGAPLRWTGYGLMGLGGASLVMAVIVDLDTLERVDAYKEAARLGDAEAYERRKEEAADGQLTTILLYGAGALLGAGGVALWMLGQPDAEEPAAATSRWDLAPTVGEVNGASLRVRW